MNLSTQQERYLMTPMDAADLTGRKLVGFYSLDANGVYRDDFSQLKFVSRDQIKSRRVNMNLNHNLKNRIKRLEKCRGLRGLLHYLEIHRDVLDVFSKSPVTMDQVSFVCSRGSLRAISKQPYENTEPLRLSVWLVNGVIYMHSLDTPEKNREMTVREITMSAWGYKFEQYMVSGTIHNITTTLIAIAEGKTEGTNGRGRPRDAYMDQLKRDMNCGSYVELKRLAENREEWRRKTKLVADQSNGFGVAVLSICGSSSSDITEPGSPYSPASSASSASGSEGAPGEGARPPWPWVPTTTSSPVLTAVKAKRPRADKCTNLESLITKKLHKNAAMPAHPEPAANYNNNILVNTEEKKSNTQTSQHCCIQRPEETSPGMPATKVLNQPPQSSECISQLGSIPKHIIHKVVPQQSHTTTLKAPILSRSAESRLKDDGANQGRITEYYKSQMKPNNGLKRDYTAALINRVTETKGKMSINDMTKGANESSESLGNYLSYLSQTFSCKMAMNNVVHQKPTESTQRVIALPITQLNQNITAQKIDLEKKPIPALNPISNVKNTQLSNITQKTETISHSNGDLQSKTLKDTKSRIAGSKLSSKRTKALEGRRSTAPKITKSSQTTPLMSVDKNIDNISPTTSKVETTVTNKSVVSSLNATDNISRQIALSAIHDHMRQVLLQSQTSQVKKRVYKTNSQKSLNNLTSDRVPSVSNSHMLISKCNVNDVVTNTVNPNIQLISNSATIQSTISNSIISATSAPSLQVTSSPTTNTNSRVTSIQECETNKSLLNSVPSNTTSMPSVTVPPATVMLTAIRIPQPNIQQPPIVNSDNSRTTPSHIAISPTKINGQFVLPMVQNINGALVQIPSLVTKVSQNTVLPLNSQNSIQRTENLVCHQQTTQMYINGTLLKINGPMHPNLPGLIAKQMTATSNTNVSYTITQKNLPGTVPVPTVMASKSNFAMNINHPIFVSSPGFILNPMAGVVTAQSSSATSMPIQQQFSGNMVLTTSHPSMHVNQAMNNNLAGLSVPPGTIPISPIKLGDINRVFLAPPRSVVPKMTTAINQQPTCNTMTSCTPSTSTPAATVNIQQSLEQIMNTTLPKLNTIVDNPTLQSIQIPTSAMLDSCTSSEANIFENIDMIRDADPVVHCTSPSPSPVSPKLSRDISTDSTDIEISNVDNSLLISEETKTSIDSSSDDSNSNAISMESMVSDISKEIDEDSVSANQTIIDKSNNCMRSTHLSVPQIIRFPPKNNAVELGSKANSRVEIDEIKICRWNGCPQNFDDSYSLIEHLKECHVSSQAGKETFTCLWEGCRVYNRSSCSRTWLERHVPSHGGTKVFGCIVEGCGQSFNTQLSLQRHVNNHFSEPGSNNASVKKSIEVGCTVPKLVRRNGKKLRYRRQPWSARIFDFFDAGIMEGLQYRVVRTSAWRTGEAAGCKPSLYTKERTATTITLAATVIAKRLHETHKYYECLVTWTPSDVIQDEWLPEKDFVPVKDIPISSLDASARDILYSGFCSSYRQPVAVGNSNSLDYLSCHNNTKTDSLVTDTANEISLFVNNDMVKREEDVTVKSERKQLTGAARRKQWRR